MSTLVCRKILFKIYIHKLHYHFISIICVYVITLKFIVCKNNRTAYKIYIHFYVIPQYIWQFPNCGKLFWLLKLVYN